MKALIAATLIAAFATPAVAGYKYYNPYSAPADVYVNGYYRNNGTYVNPHWRTSPDGYEWNNRSYNGNNTSIGNSLYGNYGRKRSSFGSDFEPGCSLISGC